MTVLNTEMHVVTFIITAFESSILFFSVIWYLSRPEDKARKRYVILLSLLIMYNVLSALFPDKDYSLPIRIQMIFAYLGGFSVSMYFVYYIYKTLELERLKTIAVYGAIGGLFLPYIGLFVIPYMITGNFDFSRRLTVIIPIGFSIYYIYVLTKSILPKFRAAKQKVEKEGILGLYISVLLWGTLPIIVYFDLDELLEHCITNTGFMIMSIVYVRSAIFKSRTDYKELRKSKVQLERSNEILQQKVKERTQELELANEKRLNSFINLMHETKTPLTLVNNCVEDLMQKYGESEEMDITRHSLSKLNRNMTNFFDVNKLERGIHIYDHSIITNFSELIDNIVLIFTPWAVSKGIKINLFADEKIHIKADPEALYRIADNLLENAIKYSGVGGEIEIKVKMEGDDQICLSVKDNGQGIPAELHQKIFQPYFQVDHKKRNVQGIGMGLALVKRTVESLDGQIELNSKVGVGTEIKVLLPKSEIGTIGTKSYTINDFHSKNQHFNIEANDIVGKKDRYNILIVEDQEDLLYRLTKQLSDQYNTYISRNGVEAIEKLEEITVIPDLIISDIMMDEMDGYDFVKNIRAQKAFQHVPIIFITAISAQNEKIKGLKMGAIDFVSKPFSIDELRTKIESILDLQEQQKMALVEQATSLLRNGKSIEKINGKSFKQKCKEFDLTPRQTDIAELMIEGRTYKQVSEALFISEKTVARHSNDIFKKLEVKSRYELINLFDQCKNQV